MTKIVKLPQPIDAQGNLLSPEEIDTLSQEPTYVPVTIALGEVEATFFMACDFDEVPRSSDRAYQAWRVNFWKELAGATESGSNSKQTNLAVSEEAANKKRVDTMMERAYSPETQDVYRNLFFSGEGTSPIILGHNIPNIGDIKEYVLSDRMNSSAILQALVAKYDPTNPLLKFTSALSRAGEAVKAATSNNPETKEEHYKQVIENLHKSGTLTTEERESALQKLQDFGVGSDEQPEEPEKSEEAAAEMYLEDEKQNPEDYKTPAMNTAHQRRTMKRVMPQVRTV